jgi:hypothetical protein
VAAVVVVVVLCFSVRGLGVGMASKCIGHSLSLIGTRIVFVSSICRRNSSVSYWYSGLYCFRSARTMRLTLMDSVCRTFYMRSPFGSSTVPVPLTFCNLLLPIWIYSFSRASYETNQALFEIVV